MNYFIESALSGRHRGLCDFFLSIELIFIESVRIGFVEMTVIENLKQEFFFVEIKAGILGETKVVER